MNNGSLRGGYSRGQPFNQNNPFVFQSPKNMSPFTRGGFTRVNGPQGTSGIVEDLIYQICFKSYHTVDIYWHRFFENYVPIVRGFNKGKGPRSAYMTKFDGFASPYQSVNDYGNFNYIQQSFHPASGTHYYSGSDASTPGAAYMANSEGAADDG